MQDHSKSMFVNQQAPVREGDDELFAIPRYVKAGKHVVAIGIAQNGEPFKITSSLDWAAKRKASAAARHAEVSALAPELDEMLADLDAMRNGSVAMVRLTPEQAADIERERPGEDFSTRPWEY